MLMWALIIVFAVFILFFMIPLRFDFEYSEKGFLVSFKVFFLKFKFPKEENKKAEKQEVKSKDKKNGSLKMLLSVINPALKALGKLVRMLTIRKLVLNLNIASNDAFSTAMMYGGAAAVISSLFPLLDSKLKIKRKYISVYADFKSNESTAYFFAKISILIWQVVAIAIYFICLYLKKTIKEKKGIKENG